MADPATYREAVGDFIARPGHGWAGLPFFAGTAQALAERLDEKRQAGAVICPPPEQVFAALRATPLADVRAVILGQDPYPTPGDAHGFAFSVPSCRPIPRSLKFIFDAYSADLGLPRPANGDLTGWARRGVLLLNCIFTVESGSSNAHRHLGWEALAREVIERINARREGVLFLLWGRDRRVARPQHRPRPPCGGGDTPSLPSRPRQDTEGRAPSICFRPPLRHRQFGAAKPGPAGDRLGAQGEQRVAIARNPPRGPRPALPA